MGIVDSAKDKYEAVKQSVLSAPQDAADYLTNRVPDYWAEVSKDALRSADRSIAAGLSRLVHGEPTDDEVFINENRDRFHDAIARAGLQGNEEITDDDWIRQVMFMPRTIPASGFRSARAQHTAVAREWTEGVVNFADTTLGGNRSINPRPQFTEFADQDVDSLLFGVTDGSSIKSMGGTDPKTGGMGRFYTESTDRHANRIYMDFGVAQFNSLGNFFTNFFSPDHAAMVNTGRINGLLYTAAKVVGYLYLWPIHLIIGFTQTVYNAANFLLRRPRSRYYYMRPTMELYWSMVNTIVSAISVNMGLLPDYNPHDHEDDQSLKKKLDEAQYGESDEKGGPKVRIDEGKNPGMSAEYFEAYQRFLPDIFRNDNGGIDARAVASRYQALANLHQAELEKVIKPDQNMEQNYTNLLAAIKERRNGIVQPINTKDLADFVAQYISTPAALGYGLIDASSTLIEAKLNETKGEDGEGQTSSVESVDTSQPFVVAPTKEQKDETAAIGTQAVGLQNEKAQAEREGLTGEDPGWFDWFGGFTDEMQKWWDVGRRDGWAWASFIVDYNNNITESVSNSTRTSSVAETMNAKSSESRNMMFNIAGGNVGEGMLASMAEFAVGGVKSIVQGLANSVGLSGLAALGGAAFADIPDFWESSETTLPSNNYTIQLRSPYGNPMSLMINVYFPLAMLLAGAVPRSTGKNSYSSPFLCRLWQKGRTQVGLGIISDISITRGSSNVGWNINDQAVAIDVSFSITNLSKMMHMPISPETSLKDSVGLGIFEESNNFTDYMAVLAGLGLAEQFYHKPNLKRQMVMSQARWDTWMSSTNFALGFFHGTLPGRLINGLSMEATF